MFCRLEKDYSQRISVINGQREKLLENHKKETEKLYVRRDDLDKQLQSMKGKFKERMDEFLMRKKSLEEGHFTILSESNETTNAEKLLHEI